MVVLRSELLEAIGVNGKLGFSVVVEKLCLEFEWSLKINYTAFLLEY